jgi:hypothetical protein
MGKRIMHIMRTRGARLLCRPIVHRKKVGYFTSGLQRLARAATARRATTAALHSHTPLKDAYYLGRQANDRHACRPSITGWYR